MNGSEANSTQGFWGPVTASIDWCEPNYIVSPYVAEFWNTVSNVALVFLPLIVFGQYRRYQLETRFQVLTLATAVVGLGSALFHSTLLFYCQLADELPMLWASFVNLYILVHDSKRARHPVVPYMLALFTLLWTAGSPWTHLYYPLWFELLFGAIQVVALGLLIERLVQSDNTTNNLKFFVAYLAFHITAFVLWSIDNKYCGVILSSPYGQHWLYPFVGSLHGWWHMLMVYILVICFPPHFFFKNH
ncbi:Alkaline ceramidase 3 [Balamuthia mandrillaris]